MKTCSKCGESKPFEAFHRDRHCSDGMRLWCKPCAKAARKAWHDANPEKVKAERKAWKDANHEKVKAWYVAAREVMQPSYIASKLHIPVKDLTPELLALKREQLEIHRLAREAKQKLKELQNETSPNTD
jgi:hypothetical protein